MGRRGSGRPPPWCPQGGLLPAGTCWTLLADWWGLQRHCGGIGGRGLFGPQLTRGSRGHTCRTLPRAGSVSASRIGVDRKGAHGRVYSDRAVDHSRCEADQTSGIALARLSSQVRAVGWCWFSDAQWAASSTAGRLRRPECEAVQEGGPPLARGQSVCCCTVHTRADTGSFGQRVETPLPEHGSFTVYMTGL